MTLAKFLAIVVYKSLMNPLYLGSQGLFGFN